MKKNKKKMRKKFIVGKKPTIKTFLITCIVLFLMDILFVGLLMMSIGANEFRNTILIIFYIILFLVYVPTVMVCSEHWDVSDTHLEYYSINGHLSQLIYAFNVLSNKEDMFSSKIELRSIKEIRLFWKEGVMGGGLAFGYYKCYTIYFAVTLVDGSVIIIPSLANNNNNKEFVNAINYLKNNYDIIVEDTYGLLDVISNPNLNLFEYINEIEKKLDAHDKNEVEKHD